MFARATRRTLLEASRRRSAGGPAASPAAALCRVLSSEGGSSGSGIGAYKHNFDSIIEQRAEMARQELATLAAAFMRYDGDGNGHLDRDELLHALADLNLASGEVDVDTLFRTLDRNNDGAIQLTEWLDHLPRGTRIKIVDNFGADADAAGGVCGASVDGHRTVRMKMPGMGSKVVYTYTDEAPMLATYSLLPIVRVFARAANVEIELKDISVAGRILANFPDALTPAQRVPDALAELGELAKTPQANIIKLPNVSAAKPQLTEAIAELRRQGYAVPLYDEADAGVALRYAKVLGSSVNPVLREGNSDRRVAAPVKAHAKAHPHKLKPWPANSRTHVAHMTEGDYFGAELSATMEAPCTLRIEHVAAAGGHTTVLKPKVVLQRGEVVDATKMDVAQLRAFYRDQMEQCLAAGGGLLLSLHLKATMMKVSDPIMFGHAVAVYYEDALDKHAALLNELGVNLNNGIGDVYAKLAGHPLQAEVEADLAKCYEGRPPLAMVDSGRGITNLHAPNDVIIDASVPPVIRDGGRMWNWADELADTKMLIPDRSYATMYAAVVEDCRARGNFDVATMGNVANVGLMAQKAEEYGSHDKTFEMSEAGVVRVVDASTGAAVFEHSVGAGDIWRLCQTKDAPIRDWVKLAVSRARATGSPAVFWLDKDRAHDASLLKKVETYLGDHDTAGLTIQVLPPAAAMAYTLRRVRRGEDTISVTGNVLRDYLTDLFPILELGTSAKMLSVVPLLAGGGLFETGAGGSAPKHVQQLVKENHLRWDSLGEFLALAVSLEDLAGKTDNPAAQAVAAALNTAVGKVLSQGKSPARKVGTMDNRGSHFYLALYWAEALANQAQDGEGGGGGSGASSALGAGYFGELFADLQANEAAILAELAAAEGSPVDLGGYYHPDPAKAEAAMRPSKTLNAIIDARLEAVELTP